MQEERVALVEPSVQEPIIVIAPEVSQDSVTAVEEQEQSEEADEDIIVVEDMGQQHPQEGALEEPEQVSFIYIDILWLIGHDMSGFVQGLLKKSWIWKLVNCL